MEYCYLMTKFTLRSVLSVFLIIGVLAGQIVSAQSDEVVLEPTGQVVEATVNLNVREGAGTNFTVIGGIAPGMTYEVWGQDGDWFIINFDGQTGYVSAGFVRVSGQDTPEVEQPSLTEPTGQVVEAFVNLNVRVGAGTNFAVIGGIAPGTNYDVYGTVDGWYVINYEDQVGYISSAFVRDVMQDEDSEAEVTEPEVEQPSLTEPTGQVVEAFVNLNVRAGAGTNFAVIGGIAPGTNYDVYGTVDGWYVINYEDQVGYISSAFVRDVTPTDAPAEEAEQAEETLTPLEGVTAVASLTVNVRTGAGTEYRIIGQIHADEVYGVYGDENGWVLIDYHGQVGYVFGELVTVTGQ
jgi:uncharacterized protein YgiM (DUF1202 family)